MSENEYNVKPEETKAPKQRKVTSYLLEFLIYAVLIFFCICIVPNYIIQRTVVSGASMQDTLEDKESLLVDKISYRFSAPKRYDIIVFYPKGRDVDEYYVKRIFGLPGETVQIKDNDIYINDEKVEDPYAKDAMSSAGIANEPYTLGDDEYFVLGDHRSISVDSRYIDPDSALASSAQAFVESHKANADEIDNYEYYEENGPGPVKFENIAGKVILRIWPLKKFGSPD